LELNKVVNSRNYGSIKAKTAWRQVQWPDGHCTYNTEAEAGTGCHKRTEEWRIQQLKMNFGLSRDRTLQW
jgi:hypothetical protein